MLQGAIARPTRCTYSPKTLTPITTKRPYVETSYRLVLQLRSLVDAELSEQFTEHVMQQLLAASDDILKKENMVRNRLVMLFSWISFRGYGTSRRSEGRRVGKE